MTRVAILALAVICLVASALMGGRDPLGRVALSMGMPDLAQRIFESRDWRATAAYRAGNFEAARDLLVQNRGAGFYNLGNSLTHTGQYAAALEAFDAALAQNPDDADAQANYDLVAAYYAGTQIDPNAAIKWAEDKEGATVAANIARGSARAAGTGDGVTNTGALVGLPEVLSAGDARVRKVFDDKFMVATDRWLATLDDVPGEFLAQRISHEHKRRKTAGIGQEPGEEE